MNRRGFVRTLPAVVAAFSPVGCTGTAYLVPQDLGGRVAVPVDVLGDGSGIFLVHPSSKRPIFVSRSAGGEWVAVHARCTHRGCQPEPVAGRLVCPCHGSEFALDGEVLEGPARSNLARLPVERVGPDLVIRLREEGS